MYNLSHALSLSATDGVVTFSAVLAEFPATTLEVLLEMKDTHRPRTLR